MLVDLAYAGTTSLVCVKVAARASRVENPLSSESFSGTRLACRLGGTIESAVAGRDLALAAAHIQAAHPLAFPEALATALSMQLEARLEAGDPEIRGLGERVQLECLGA